MVINNCLVAQNGNQYFIYLPTNICVAQISMPRDSQFAEDAKILEIIVKEIAIRHGVYERKRRKG